MPNLASCRLNKCARCHNRVALFNGINTGFGLLANTRINVDELELLAAAAIVLSHAAVPVDFMSEGTVASVLLLKINSLKARGYSRYSFRGD